MRVQVLGFMVWVKVLGFGVRVSGRRTSFFALFLSALAGVAFFSSAFAGAALAAAFFAGLASSSSDDSSSELDSCVEV